MTRFGLLSLLLLVVFVGNAQDPDYRIIARNNGQQIMWDGETIRVFGFTQRLTEKARLPNKPIYLVEGDTTIIKFNNVSQGAPHTIHPHGLDVDQQNDGVPHLSFTVEHADFAYYYIPGPHPGTYLYHCHVVSALHVQLGMYGMMIVRPKYEPNRAWAGGPAFDKEYAWLMSDVDSYWHTDSIAELHFKDENQKTLQLPEYRPDYFLINGKQKQQLGEDTLTAISAAVNEKIILRLGNIGFYATDVFLPEELFPIVIASDGRPLPQFKQWDSVRIYPGERYDVMLYPTEEMEDIVVVKHVNMNTAQVANTEFVPVKIEGTISVDELDQKIDEGFVCYPSPSSGIVYVQSKIEDTALKIYSLDGKLLYSEELIGFEDAIDLTKLVRGPQSLIFMLEDSSGKLYGSQVLQYLP